MNRTVYELPGPEMDIALVADMHERNLERVLRIIDDGRPDLIAVAGDMTDTRHGDRVNDNTLHSFEQLAKRAPVYFTAGNHERYMTPEDARRIERTGAKVLDNEWTDLGDNVFLGGLSSLFLGTPLKAGRPDPRSFIRRFSALPGYRILICHHPEYYGDIVPPDGIDLMLSGHAHGGQWRFFGQGLIAPGQGFFPKYTKGVYDGKLVVSAGVSNSSAVPRIADPTEVVYVRLGGGK